MPVSRLLYVGKSMEPVEVLCVKGSHGDGCQFCNSLCRAQSLQPEMDQARKTASLVEQLSLLVVDRGAPTEG